MIETSRERIDAITIDGKEGGTSMSPIASMSDLGLPTISYLSSIRKSKGERKRDKPHHIWQVI